MNPQSQWHREQIEILCAPYRKEGERGYVIPEHIASLVDQHERAAAAIEEDDAEPNEADSHALRAEGLEGELQGSKATIATYQLQVVTLAGQLELAREANREWEAKLREQVKWNELQAETIRGLRSGIVDVRSTVVEQSQVTAAELNDLQARWQKTEDQRFAACEQVENLEGSLRVAVGDLGRALLTNGKLESCCRHWKAVAVRGMRIMRNRLDRAEADLTLAENDRDSYADQLEHVRQRAARFEAAGRQACEALAGEAPGMPEAWQRVEQAEEALQTTFARHLDISQESWCSSLVLAMTNELDVYRQAERAEISNVTDLATSGLVDPNSDTQALRCQECGKEKQEWEQFQQTGNAHTGGAARWVCRTCWNVLLERRRETPPPQDLNARLAADEPIEEPPESASDLLDATDERFERTEFQLPTVELSDAAHRTVVRECKTCWSMRSKPRDKTHCFGCDVKNGGPKDGSLPNWHPVPPLTEPEPLTVVPKSCSNCKYGEIENGEPCDSCSGGAGGDASPYRWRPDLGSTAQPTPEPPSKSTALTDSDRALLRTAAAGTANAAAKSGKSKPVTPPEAILSPGRSCDGKSEIPSSNPVTEPPSELACQNMAKRLDTLTPERGTSSLARRVLDKIAKAAGLAPDEDLALRVLVKRPGAVREGSVVVPLPPGNHLALNLAAKDIDNGMELRTCVCGSAYRAPVCCWHCAWEDASGRTQRPGYWRSMGVELGPDNELPKKEG
jgi:hypothetical protein